MKTFLLSALSLFISAGAFAEIPEIRAKDVTCQELKDAVLNYGQITVVTKSFLFKKRLTVSQEIECGAGLIKSQALFKTSDIPACAAGVYCADNSTVIIVVDHGPRHERYRWRHRPTHPRPDHHHPRGPRYNPRPDRPHDRGPRYNPRPDRPHRDRPSHDRPSRGGGCHGRHCSL